MNKLLAVNFDRLKKNQVFWLGSALMLLAGALFPLISYFEMKKTGWEAELDSNFFTYTVFIIILLSVFCSLFIGTDYSNGTIRNKLIVGNTRSAIYLSNFVISVAAGAFMCLAYILPYLALGIPLLGSFVADIRVIIGIILCVFVMTLAFTGIFTLISMLCSSKASTAVACILCAFLLLFSGMFIEARLNEPETYSAYSYTDNTGTHSELEQPNPNYLRGKKREVYEFLYDFLPGCQAIQLSGMKGEHPGKMAAYSLAITALTTGFGLIIFRKKDLK